MKTFNNEFKEAVVLCMDAAWDNYQDDENKDAYSSFGDWLMSYSLGAEMDSFDSYYEMVFSDMGFNLGQYWEKEEFSEEDIDDIVEEWMEE